MRKISKSLKLSVAALVILNFLHRGDAAEREIYPAPAQAGLDLAAGVKTAAASHKRVILDFGGNWCGDCQVLDLYFHNAANKPILESNYVLVRINVGHLDQNQAIAARYSVVLSKGVPVLAVLDEHGKLVFSQRTPVFESVQGVQSSAITNFLVRWKPVKPGCSAVQAVC